MEGLTHCGLLRARTSAEEWLLLSEEDLLSPPGGYVVSFAHFHEHGFINPPPPQISLGAAALLQHRATASQPQQDPAHGGVHRPVRGAPGDQPPLRSMEVLLHCHPPEQEGEEQQAGAVYADGVRRHLAPKQSGQRVPAHAALDVQQGVALTVVLPQE